MSKGGGSLWVVGGGGGGGGGAATPTPATADQFKQLMGLDTRKALFYSHDLQGTTISPVTSVLTSAATSTQLIFDDGRYGVYEIKSSSTSGSSGFVGCGYLAVPVESKPVVTIYFKTPPVMDAQLNLQFGYTTSTTTGDRCCIDIVGTTAQAKNVIGGTTTISGTSFTVAADTWYIGRLTGLASNSVKLALYSATGTLAASSSTPASMRGINSNTTVRTLFKADLVEIYIPITSSRYILPN